MSSVNPGEDFLAEELCVQHESKDRKNSLYPKLLLQLYLENNPASKGHSENLNSSKCKSLSHKAWAEKEHRNSQHSSDWVSSYVLPSSVVTQCWKEVADFEGNGFLPVGSCSRFTLGRAAQRWKHQHYSCMLHSWLQQGLPQTSQQPAHGFIIPHFLYLFLYSLYLLFLLSCLCCWSFWCVWWNLWGGEFQGALLCLLLCATSKFTHWKSPSAPFSPFSWVCSVYSTKGNKIQILGLCAKICIGCLGKQTIPGMNEHFGMVQLLHSTMNSLLQEGQYFLNYFNSSFLYTSLYTS